MERGVEVSVARVPARRVVAREDVVEACALQFGGRALVAGGHGRGRLLLQFELCAGVDVGARRGLGVCAL